MATSGKTGLGPGILLATTLLALSAAAQEPDDELMPAVDTSAPVQALDEGRGEPAAGEPSSDEAPAIPTGVERDTAGNQVMDRMELGRTEITGNQELPKVLYIVPWQKSDPGDLMGRPVNSLLDEVLAPIDREEFVRQVNYHGDLYGDQSE